MAYQMIHMEVAYRLLERLSFVTNRAEFILGAVAPDSVHMNPDYEVSQKVKSHLFYGCGDWGNTRDYKRWNHNIMQYWKKREKSIYTPKEKDFIAGICTHCLTDYSNDLNIWRRLQKENIPPMTLKEFQTAYYPEAKGIDVWLHENSKYKDEIVTLLSQGQPYELDGIIKEGDVLLMKHHLLYKQYADCKAEITDYQFLSEKSIMEFIDLTVNHIEEQLKL